MKDLEEANPFLLDAALESKLKTFKNLISALDLTKDAEIAKLADARERLIDEVEADHDKAILEIGSVFDAARSKLDGLLILIKNGVDACATRESAVQSGNPFSAVLVSAEISAWKANLSGISMPTCQYEFNLEWEDRERVQNFAFKVVKACSTLNFMILQSGRYITRVKSRKNSFWILVKLISLLTIWD